MYARSLVAGAARLATVALGITLAGAPLAAQDFRVAGGLALPRIGRGGSVGGQGQASIELGPQGSGFGMRLDLLYAQTPSAALSLTDVVRAGQATRTYAAAGGIFYRREVRDVAPYLLAGAGAYGQTATAGVSLGVHGGVGVDWSANRSRPFAELRVHRLQGEAGAVALQQRERSLVSALVGLRF